LRKKWKNIQVYVFIETDFIYKIAVKLVKLIINIKATLGEGVFWHPIERKVYWVDIYEKKNHCTNPETGINKTYEVSECVGTIAPDTSGNLIVAIENSIVKLNTVTGKTSMLLELEKELVNNRFNDGKFDPFGRFWLGSMCREGIHKTESLYSIDSNLRSQKKIEEVTVSNGIAWDSKKNKMYYIDSPTKCVMAYDYDGVSGNISKGKKSITFSKSMGFPDGMTIDHEGMLWIALWGGYAVVRCNPDTGEVLQKIDVPAPHVTSCTFGGVNMNKLYITTAQEGLTEQELIDYPLSGGLFEADLSVSGCEVFFFKTSN
jgi:sugar lactone lactonase YvrE